MASVALASFLPPTCRCRYRHWFCSSRSRTANRLSLRLPPRTLARLCCRRYVPIELARIMDGRRSGAAAERQASVRPCDFVSSVGLSVLPLTWDSAHSLASEPSVLARIDLVPDTRLAVISTLSPLRAPPTSRVVAETQLAGVKTPRAPMRTTRTRCRWDVHLGGTTSSCPGRCRILTIDACICLPSRNSLKSRSRRPGAAFSPLGSPDPSAPNYAETPSACGLVIS